MFSLSSLLHIPDVVIKDLDTTVEHSFPIKLNPLRCSVRGKIINKSATGSGELEELVLRIFLDNEEHLDIPVRRGEPDIIGFRFQPNGRYPDDRLDFEWLHLPPDITISGRQAEIRLQVIGQGLRKYRVRMSVGTMWFYKE